MVVRVGGQRVPERGGGRSGSRPSVDGHGEVPSLPAPRPRPKEGELYGRLLIGSHGDVDELDVQRRGPGRRIVHVAPLVPGPVEPERGASQNPERPPRTDRAHSTIELPHLEPPRWRAARAL